MFSWIRNFSGRFSWIRNPGLLQVDDLGPKHQFWQWFKEFGVCCWNLVSYINALIMHIFQDFEFAVFKPFYQDVFFVEMFIYIVFGGLTPIDWTSKPLLHFFNFRSFFVVLASKMYTSNKNFISGPHFPHGWVNEWSTFTPQKTEKQQNNHQTQGVEHFLVQKKIQ